jgi:hypothetical protein
MAQKPKIDDGIGSTASPIVDKKIGAGGGALVYVFG